MSSGGRTYEAAGVSLAAAEEVVQRLRAAVESTGTEGFGAFAGLYPLDERRLLAASTDSVGSKLVLSRRAGRLRDGGRDLAAHCINDVLTTGAEPLFFLDYVAAHSIDLEQVAELVEGAAEVCREAGCALIGGETAEMPGMYAAGDYDLAGFCVGAVERSQVLTGSRVAPGDVVLGLASSGVHSNGFSLVRRIIAENDWDVSGALGKQLLAPTRIYVAALLPLVRAGLIHGLAHITGGGLLENVPRVLGETCRAVIDADAWELPVIFETLQRGGNIAPEEMARTFNCGIGMVALVPAEDAEKVTEQLEQAGETVFHVGRIEEGQRGCTVRGSAGRWAATEDWSATHDA